MRRFLRWLLGIDRDALFEALHDNFTAMSQELQDARDSLDHMDRRFTRLQQQVTRWARDVDEDDVDDEDEVINQILARRNNG